MARSWIALFALLTTAGCSQQSQPQLGTAGNTALTKETTAAFKPQKLSVKHLPNAIRVHEKVISGGQPDGEEGFRELAELGVKTVISVDGAKPDVVVAKKYGLRYVHLPHGYDGIPDERVKELAKAVSDLPGPIYIHCHHGKHRSPAAATVACVSCGLVPPESALGILKLAGASENYRGLFDSAQSARPLPEAVLQALEPDFPETAELPAMAEAMVAIEHTHDHLKEAAAAEWQRPPAHPDIEPPHEALLLREHFSELLRTEEVAHYPQRFRDLLAASEQASGDLEAALRRANAEGTPVVDRAEAKAAFDRVTAGCAACHKEFRDVPLREKQARWRIQEHLNTSAATFR